jgi:hypothetical protein
MVDPALDVPYGPHPVNGKSGTITLPAPLRSILGLELGGEAHWFLNPDIPGTVILIPSRDVARVTSELLSRIRDSGG